MMLGTGSGAPTPCRKAFTFLRLVASERAIEPRMQSWKPELRNQYVVHILWVDTPAKGSFKDMEDIDRISEGLIEKWEGPLQSPASSWQEQRVTYTAYFR